jgi:hypothetical protein
MAGRSAGILIVAIMGGGLGEGEIVVMEDRLEERAIAGDNMVAKKARVFTGLNKVTRRWHVSDNP